MRNVKIFGILVSALLLTACGAGEPNTLFETASPETAIMAFYVYDGAETTCYWLSDDTAEWEIINAMKATSAVPAEVTTDDVEFPAYGFELGSTDGWGLYMAWSNGYLYNRDGEVYEFEFDFDKLLTDYAFTEEWSRSDGMALPCMRYLVQDENGWKKEFLKSGTLETREGVYAEIGDSIGDEITVVIKNDTAEDWRYGDYFSVQVKLDGEWYDIPVSPVNNWAFNDIAYELEAGGRVTRSYHLAMYGDLPVGEYRFIVDGESDVFVEFRIRE